MADVKFERTYLEDYAYYFLIPEFGETIKSIEGKQLEIKGYVLDLVEGGTTFLLSQHPMATCFFCGMAGPETIIELQFETKQTLKTDQIITVQGILALNKSDINHCNYILTDVVIIK